MSDGNVSKFISKLFNATVILFVGYSYNDTIMRYLTRALSEHDSKNKFILTDNTDNDWRLLGLTPIYFSKGRFDQLDDGLFELGKIANKTFLGWKSYFQEISANPPNNDTDISILDYCLQDIEISGVLSRIISSKEWLDILESKGVFDNIFSKSNPINKFDELWARWIINTFIGKDDSKIIELFYRRKNKLSKYFADSLLRKVTYHGHDITDDYYQKYVLYLDDFITDRWIIRELIKNSVKRDLYYLCLHLFEKYFVYSFSIEKNTFADTYEYCHHFIGDYHDIMDSWNECEVILLNKYSKKIILFLTNVLNKLLCNYLAYSKEPYHITYLVIESRKDEPFRYETLHAIEKIFSQSRAKIEIISPEFVRAIINTFIQSDSILMKKIGLKNLRETKVFSENEKYDILMRYSSITFSPEKEQVFLLIAAIFNRISKDRKDSFIDILESMNATNSQHGVYEIYNWGIWLQRFCQDNERINKLVNTLQANNNFQPRENPERDIGRIISGWVKHGSPYSEKELKELSKDSILDHLRNYQESNTDNFLERIDREGFLSQFSECVRKDYLWAVSILTGIVENKISNDDVWIYLLNGIENSNYSIEELIEILGMIMENYTIIPDLLETSRLLMKIIEKDGIESKFKKYENFLFAATEKLWQNRDKNKPDMDPGFYVLNTTTGIVLLCWVKMIHLAEERVLQEKYKFHFNSLLSDQTWEKIVAINILAGHFTYFYHKDAAWTIKYILPMLEGAEKESFIFAWDGFVNFSRYLDLSIADIMSSLFLKAVTHIRWLPSNMCGGFIDYYLLLLIKVIKNPISEYIPEFYTNASEENKTCFIEKIEERLSSMGAEEKSRWWLSWLKIFIENRMNNIPEKISESEKVAIFRLLPLFDDEFDEASEIICSSAMPKEVDLSFLFSLDEGNLGRKHPQSTINLIIALINADTHFYVGEQYLENIIKSAIDMIDDQQKSALQEALLRKNININL